MLIIFFKYSLLKKINKILPSGETGSMLLFSMVFVSLTLLTTILVSQTVVNLKIDAKRAKIRSIMTILETQIRNLASEPFAYTNCTNYSTCEVNSDLFKKYTKVPIPGAKCPTSNPKCGAKLEWAKVDCNKVTSPSLRIVCQFKATLSYEGEDVAIAKKQLVVDIPIDILQSTVISCSAGYMTGYDVSTGTLSCRQPTICSHGQYADSINSETLDATCQNFPSGGASAGDWIYQYYITNEKTGSSGSPKQEPCWWEGRL